MTGWLAHIEHCPFCSALLHDGVTEMLCFRLSSPKFDQHDQALHVTISGVSNLLLAYIVL